MTNANKDLLQKAIELKGSVARLKRELAEAQSLNVELCDAIKTEGKEKAISHYLRPEKQYGISYKQAAKKAETNWYMFISGESKEKLKKANYPLT